MGGREHFSSAFQWSSRDFHVVELLTAALGMAVPIMIGWAVGDIPAGFLVGVGAMAVGGPGVAPSARGQILALGQAVGPALLAACVAGVAGAAIGHGWKTDAIVIASAALAAIGGGYSRDAAQGAGRFVLLVVMLETMMTGPAYRPGFVFVVAIGALWAAALNLSLSSIARMCGRSAATPNSETKTPTSSQKRARLARSLRRLEGWQYPLRLVACLSIAALVRAHWPDHRFNWIALTVALLTQRQLDMFPVRTTQRAIGTAIGVLLSVALVEHRPPAYALALGAGTLAGVRPLLKAGNYLLYSIVMTPLVILMIDAGEPPGYDVLVDRLVATLIGAALVIVANFVIIRALDRESDPS